MLKRLKRIAKNLLAVTWVRRTYEVVNRVVLEVFGSLRLFVYLYYAVSFMTFNREQTAVLRGRRDYYRNKGQDRVTRVELRRNIHRLEKGLIMRPRRDVFARDYITETIEFYESAADQCRRSPETMDPDEFAWAHDVLSEYFRANVAPDATVDAARERFERADAPVTEGSRRPHPKEDRSAVAYEELLALSEQRRSVRWFAPTTVPREDVDRALLVARQAPTACNRLPYEFRVYDDPEMVRTVADIPFGAVGYAHNIPSIVVVVGDLASYFSPRDRHAIYVDASLAAMSFMFALETLGLSSSVINWPDFEPLEAQMQRTLGLSSSQRVVMLIAVGYAHPEGLVPYSQKKALDTFREFNRLA